MCSKNNSLVELDALGPGLFLPGLVLGLVGDDAVLVQVLHRLELGVVEQEGEADQRHTEAGAGNEQQALDVLVSFDKSHALGGAPSVLQHKLERAAVGQGDEGVVVELGHFADNLLGQGLGPDGTGDGVTEGGADVVRGQVEGGDDGHVLVVGGGLDGGLGGVGEETGAKAQETQGTHDAGLGVGAATVVDEHAHGDDPHDSAPHNEGLEVADLNNDKAEQRTGDDGDERVERGDAGGGLVGLVDGDDEHGVHVVSLHVPDPVDEDTDAHGGPDTGLLDELKGHNGDGGPALPEDKEGDDAEADDERSNDLGLAPLGADTAGEGEGHEDEGQEGDEQEEANDVELEKQPLEEAQQAALGVLGLLLADLLESAGLLCAVVHVGEADEQGHAGHGEDDGPHGDTPGPLEAHGADEVTGDPGVDDEGGCGDEGGQQTPVEQGEICGNELHEQDDAGVAKLVDDGAAGVDACVVGLGLEDGADDVEEDTETEQLRAAKDVRQSGVEGLGGDGDDGDGDVDGGNQRVGAVGGLGKGLELAADSVVEAVGVGDEEDAEEDDEGADAAVLRGDDLDAANTARLDDGPGLVLVVVGGRVLRFFVLVQRLLVRHGCHVRHD